MSTRIQQGALAHRYLDDGRELCLYRMLPGQVRLCLGPADGPMYDDAWCLHDVAAAIELVETWDGYGDPPGPWYRHIESARRRELAPDGSVLREWVAA